MVVSASANAPVGFNGAVAVPTSGKVDLLSEASGVSIQDELSRHEYGGLIYEAGVNIGLPGVDAGISTGESQVYNTSIVRDAANTAIDGLNAVRGWFGYDAPIDHIPDAQKAYSD